MRASAENDLELRSRALAPLAAGLLDGRARGAVEPLDDRAAHRVAALVDDAAGDGQRLLAENDHERLRPRVGIVWRIAKAFDIGGQPTGFGSADLVTALASVLASQIDEELAARIAL